MKSLGKYWAGDQKVLSGAKEFCQELKKYKVKIILITHIEGYQGPNRIKCLVEQGIVFDEIYFTMGRHKSEFAKELIKRYKNSVNFFMDDKAENAYDF
jgi:hypothetical protein